MTLIEMHTFVSYTMGMVRKKGEIKKKQRVAENNIGSCWVRKITTLIELKAIFLLAQLQQGFMHYYSVSFYE